MTRWHLSLLLCCGSLAVGCPDGGSKPPPSNTTPTTEKPSTETPDQTPAPDPDAALVASINTLNGAALGPPSSCPTPPCAGDTELFGGEAGIILTDPAETQVGAIFTTVPLAPTGVYVEKWVVFDTEAIKPGSGSTIFVDLASVNGTNQLDQARIDTYCAADAADTTRTYQLATENVSYLPFPQPQNITTMLAGTLSGTTATLTYDVFTMVATAAAPTATLTGALYREVRTNPLTTQVEWSDYWVLTDGYIFPKPGTYTELRPAATNHADLKSFLTAMNGRTPGPSQSWRYMPVKPIVFAPLCPPAPPPTNP